MISIRTKLTSIFLVGVSATLSFGYLTYKNYSALSTARHQLDLSFELSQDVQDLSQLERRMEIPELKPERRMQEYTQLLATVRSGNSRNIKAFQETFLKNESEFQRYTKQESRYYEENVLYYAALSLISILAGWFFMHVMVLRAVLKPVRGLSRKMVDFLHDRYTYQFSVPANDEIGHMHSTFNSLAQRVIANMEELRTLDEAKSEFLSIASHELRTPLTSIKGSLSLMRSGLVGTMNEMADNLLTIAETETDRLIRLINDILDLARIEARKLPLQQEWHPLQNLVKASMDGLNGLAQQAGVELKNKTVPPVDLYIDPDRIQQVLTNLLSNAIKFSPAGSDVTLKFNIDDTNQIRIEVSDRGRGIAPEDQQAIFQKFRQATNSKNPLVKGTGLGLAIAKALMDEHGGTIGVTSVPGEGSTFYVTLPVWRHSERRSEMAA